MNERNIDDRSFETGRGRYDPWRGKVAVHHLYDGSEISPLAAYRAETLKK